MARAYTVGTAALALDISTKWVDNILSHHRVSGIAQERQGVSRKVTSDGLLKLAVTLRLMTDLQIPASNAIRIATTLSESGGTYRTGSGLTISLDLVQLQRELETQLARAVEIAPVPRRGRPPAKRNQLSKTGRLE